jgi:hypothetical protein
MISDRTLESAILARKPKDARRIEIVHDAGNLFGKPWDVSLFWEGDGVTEFGATFGEALNKAEVSMRRKQAEATRRKAMTLVYTPNGYDREGALS